jgi:folate-binding protein YgfZ
MLHDSPLRSRHEQYLRSLTAAPPAGAQRPGAATGARAALAELQYVPYALPDRSDPACELVAAFGEIEPEYAAIRRGAGLLDSPHRGTILVTGSATDRRDFLNRMVTAELKDLAAGMVKPAFWLNRKGRIDADLLIIELGDRMLIDVDIHQAAGAAQSLGAFLFAEEVKIADASARYHHVGVHGPLALQTVAIAAHDERFTLENDRCAVVPIDGAQVIAARHDLAGEIGLELIIEVEQVAAVWDYLLAADHVLAQDKRRIRPIGWYAFNIARIEAGCPIFNIDFGTTNLPHETGVLHDRVSFTKGCYLGQEVVARMESRGHSKGRLVGLRLSAPLLPTAGAQVFESKDGSMGDEIGRVTSSTLSPMLGAVPVAFAMIKSATAAPGTTVLVNAEGEQAEAVISGLRFWPESKP